MQENQDQEQQDTGSTTGDSEDTNDTGSSEDTSSEENRPDAVA